MSRKSRVFSAWFGLALAAASFGLASTPLSLVQALEAGAKMPEIGLKDLSGNPISAATLAGKVVVIDFWATWCAPCKQEMPILQNLYKKYASQGLVIVGVSVDKDVANVKPFVQKLGVTFPIVHDAGHQVSGRYQPPRMPSSYIVDRKGIVRFVHGGFRAEDAAVFEKEIKSLLAK